MNKFTLIRYEPHSKDGVLRSIEKRFDAGLPFHIGRRHTLDIPSRRLLLVSAEASTGETNDKQHVYINGDDFLVFDGMPFFHGQDLSTPWAQRLFQLFCRVGAAEFFDKVMGDYCLIVNRGSTVCAFGDFAGLCPIFYLSHGDAFGISNRQRILQSILTDSDTPTLDPEACAFITGQGNVFGSKSIYSGVNLVAPSRYVRLSNGGVEHGGFPRFYGREQRDLSEADGTAAAEAIFQQARCLAELPLTDYQMDLTGGMDSRAVLAVAMRSGLINKVSSIKTYGPVGLPEFEVTSELAKVFKLPHENVVTTQQGAFNVDDQWRRLRLNAMAIDGAVSVDTGIAGIARTSIPCLSGTGGEIFRPHIHARRDTTLSTIDELYALVENYQRNTDPLGVHKSEATAAIRKTMRATARQYVSNGVALDDVHYLLYTEHRLPWWAGYCLSNIMGRRRLYPLVSKDAAKIVYSGTPELKKMDWLHFIVMKEADPRLIKIPFFDNKWDARLERYSGGLPMADRPFPIQAPNRSLTTASWITQFAEAQWNDLFDYVLAKPSSQVFDFVDRSALEKRRAETKWASRLASASALLSLVTFRMVEDNDVLSVKQGVPV